MNKISVHATPTDKKDGEDRGVAVVTRRRLRPITLTAVPVLAEPLKAKMQDCGQARESTTEEGLAPHNADSCGGSQKPLSGSKEIRQSRDASEGGESPTRCAFEKRHEESPPAQRSPQFQAFLDSLDNPPWRERNWKRKAANYATIR